MRHLIFMAKQYSITQLWLTRWRSAAPPSAETHFTVGTLGLRRLPATVRDPLRRDLEETGSNIVNQCKHVCRWWSCTCVRLSHHGNNGGTPRHRAQCAMEGRKFAISTRARHVSDQPPARLTKLSISNAFLFPSLIFLAGNLLLRCQNVRRTRQWTVGNLCFWVSRPAQCAVI